jgi:hypothetical protein
MIPRGRACADLGVCRAFLLSYLVKLPLTSNDLTSEHQRQNGSTESQNQSGGASDCSKG